MRMKPGFLNSDTQETTQKLLANLRDSIQPGKYSKRHPGTCFFISIKIPAVSNGFYRFYLGECFWSASVLISLGMKDMAF